MKESTLTARVGSRRHRSRDILDEIWEEFGRKSDATTNGTAFVTMEENGSYRL